jgi:DNA-binding CsgD family transcriptional regulator
VGIVSLGIVLFFYFNSKKEELKPFIYFYSSFSLIIIFNFFSSYLKTNIADYEGGLYYLFLYLENPVVFTILIFTVPYFIHTLVEIPNQNIRDKIFIALAFITFVLHNASRIIDIEAVLIQYATIFKNLVFLMVIVYCWFILLKYSGSNKFLRKLSLFWFLLIPVIINDTFLLNNTGIKLFPLIYSVVGVVFCLYYYKDTPLGKGKEIITNSGTGIQNNFAQKFDLSNREFQVVELLVDGKSYKEIAEELFISLNTVKTHIKNIYPKIGVSRRHEIVKLMQNKKHQA